MRIIHLSDIHYHPSQKSFKRYCLDPLIKDLQSFTKNKPINLICFTGDLIDKGGFAGKNSVDPLIAFEKFEEDFIKPLLENLNMSKHQFLFIPGNHDVDRTKINEYSHDGLLNKMNTRNDIDSIMHNIKPSDFSGMEPYKLFENIYYDDSDAYKPNKFGYSFLHMLNGKKIGIGGINSSWMCKDDGDDKKLFVGRKQLDFIQDSFEGQDLDLRIALMHHSYESLHPEDTEFVRDMIVRDYDLLLVGHTHKSSTFSLSFSLGNGCILSTAPANWVSNNHQTLSKYQNGYNIIDIIEDPGKSKYIEFHFRKFNFEKNQFISNTDAGEGDSGTKRFESSSTENKKLYNEQTEIIGYIKDIFTDDINQNLISYNTDTVAPKDLKSLFVLPRIVKSNYETSINNDGKEVNKKEEILNLEDLCLLENNLVLFGQRETGKTTILFRIISELIDKHALYQKIPIYVDLKGLNKGDIKKKMSRFIGKSTSKFNKILENQKIVLLLDNFRFNHVHQNVIFEEISELSKTFPNLSIIASAETINDQEKPIEFVNSPIAKEFESANIQYFQTTEIQSLMKRWFNTGGSQEENEKLNHLIKNFHYLNIPSTPLAVSMFLWIYEKQKDFRPVNNAAMVQNFIEKLFEKHTKEQIFSEDFDYSNKIHLLAQIALQMYRKNNANYRIESLELKEFIRELYKKKKMEIQLSGPIAFHDWILTEFVDKGVLVRELDQGAEYYKFKLDCFFQYCLAKNMEFNKDFKEEVLSEENYLTFIDEIDYFTGLDRTQGDILESVVNRKEKCFASYLEFNQSIFTDNTITISFDHLFSLRDPDSRKPLIESMRENQLDEILKRNKQNDEDAITANDSLLERGNDNEHSSVIPNKVPQSELSNDEKLQKTWIIAAKVLKNTEEVEIGDLKDRAFRSIMLCSLITVSVHKRKMELYLSDSNRKSELMKSNPEMYSFFSFFTRFALVVHEVHLFSVIGTTKLLPVIRDYLNENIENDSVSDVEKYLAIFLYIDSNANDYQSKLNRIMHKYNSSAVNDFAFMKLTLLHSVTKDKKAEKFIQDKLNQLIKRSKDGHVVSKSKAISSFQNKEEKDRRLELFKEASKK
ncbi:MULTISPECIES: metallophosphoesterase [unclassified Sporosarcina]|uniref:metallophosphoesterase n=1 Tax=unclassified Sporosarcina TaxID=2647733 RepID=UPI001A92E9A8|nr:MULTISPECIES: metallophosphoesterase [unclassified Sporosarcina]MBO0587580.1 metallophosphoesterase [Sporosarcina sp. E16_8]MBO0602433.1 metallophosphoesterase [Sporosarcina sp. E16_3]